MHRRVLVKVPRSGPSRVHPAGYDFTIDELGVEIAIGSSGSAVGSFTADPGTYEFYCSIPGHRESGIVGTLQVA